ncbi:MAG: acetyltransferase [Frankiales bacterium]|nr:acetyltransferase [Frankiales bacterium]
MSELVEVDRYCDAAPRSAATVEEFGSLRLFVPTRQSYHPWYARPSGKGPVSRGDLRAVLARQRELGLPLSLEWVVGRPDGVDELAASEGLTVQQHPLLVAKPDELLLFASVAEVRLVGPDDDLARIEAVAAVGFAHAGTSVGPTGGEALEEATERDQEQLARRRARTARGFPTVAVVYVDGDPVARGGHTLVDGVSEITGVATLPAYRRRGLGAAVTALLAEDAVRRGARLLWLSAADDLVARVYSRLGFREVGASGAAAG